VQASAKNCYDFGGELSQPCLRSSCEFGKEGECRDPDLSDVGMLELPPVGLGHLMPSPVETIEESMVLEVVLVGLNYSL
jgi:hypothetical protein